MYERRQTPKLYFLLVNRHEHTVRCHCYLDVGCNCSRSRLQWCATRCYPYHNRYAPGGGCVYICRKVPMCAFVYTVTSLLACTHHTHVWHKYRNGLKAIALGGVKMFQNNLYRARILFILFLFQMRIHIIYEAGDEEDMNYNDCTRACALYQRIEIGDVEEWTLGDE